MAATPHPLPVERRFPGPPPHPGPLPGPHPEPVTHLPRPVPHPVEGGHGPPLPRPPGPVITTGSARTTAINAARAAAAATPSSVNPWQPWQRTIAEAEGRLKREIQVALGQLDHANAAAGQILDTAESMAAQVAGQLESAGWAAWHKYMAEAARASETITGPAVAAYEQALSQARTDFDRAVDEAGKAYRMTLAAADEARALAAAFPRQG